MAKQFIVLVLFMYYSQCDAHSKGFPTQWSKPGLLRKELYAEQKYYSQRRLQSQISFDSSLDDPGQLNALQLLYDGTSGVNWDINQVLANITTASVPWFTAGESYCR